MRRLRRRQRMNKKKASFWTIQNGCWKANTKQEEGDDDEKGTKKKIASGKCKMGGQQKSQNKKIATRKNKEQKQN